LRGREGTRGPSNEREHTRAQVHISTRGLARVGNKCVGTDKKKGTTGNIVNGGKRGRTIAKLKPCNKVTMLVG